MADSELEIKAYAALDYGKPLEEWKYTAPPLRADQVELKMIACGVCASDVDLLRGKYGPEMTAALGYPMPMVAGHEGVGRVVAVGALVKHLAVGDAVGVGVFRDCCRNCMACVNGKNNLCPEKLLTFKNSARGCFSEVMRIKADLAFKIPEGIPLEKAGPLMCAGLTTFAPFKEHNIRPGDSVGVVGIGGLGHLALKFARAFGCRVTAFSRGTAKAEEAKSYGAHKYVDSTDAEQMKQAALSVDYLFVTAGGPACKPAELIKLIKAGGKMIVIGFIGMEVTVPMMELISFQRSVCGSAAGSSAAMKEMLEFASLHGITPETEEMPFSKVNEAIDHVAQGKAKYRVVLLW